MREDQNIYLFTLVFMVVWCGAGVVYLNAQLLSFPLSFLQTMCRLGYALSPLAMAALSCTLILNWIPGVSSVITLGAGGWSLWAAARLVSEGNDHLSDRKYLVLYPVLLYYFALTLLSILS